MMSEIKTKKCSKCGGEWPLQACYRQRNRPGEELGALSSYHPVCVMCEITDDDFAKSLDEACRVIRERKAAGGEGWKPK